MANNNMTKKERLETLQRIANLASSIQGAAECAIDYAEGISRMDSAEIERLSILLPQLEDKLREVGPYLYPLAEKFMYMGMGTTAKEADHRDYVRGQGIWIDNKGVPINEEEDAVEEN